MEAFLLEKYNIKSIQLPHDGNTVVAGDRVSLVNAKRVIFLIHMADGTGGTVTPSFIQYDAASAGSSKALSIANPYYHKKAALTKFTKVVPVAAASSFDISSIFAADEGIAAFEVLPEDLDVSNGFTHVSLDLADVTATKLVGVLALVESELNPAYENDI